MAARGARSCLASGVRAGVNRVCEHAAAAAVAHAPGRSSQDAARAAFSAAPAPRGDGAQGACARCAPSTKGCAQLQARGLTATASGCAGAGRRRSVYLEVSGGRRGSVVRGLLARAAHACPGALGAEGESVGSGVGGPERRPDGLDLAWLRRRTHTDRIGLARGAACAAATCAGGGSGACVGLARRWLRIAAAVTAMKLSRQPQEL